MGDTTDGSQEAAQRAQAEVTPQEDTHISFLDWALRRRGRAATNEPRPATDLDRLWNTALTVTSAISCWNR